MKNRILKLIKTSALATLSVFGLSTANAQYCIPTYGTLCLGPGVNDFINTVTTTGGTTNISNVGSGCCMIPGNYIFNAGMPLIAAPGATITQNVQSGAIYAQGFSVWIDWDSDFTFSAAEKVYSSPYPGGAPTSFTFSYSIPADQPCGTYRMRVRCEYAQAGTTINPCDYNYYGECEDYPVIIENCEPTICRGETTTLDFSASDPGPGSTYSWSLATEISDAFGGPLVDVWPSDTTTYTVTITDPTGATFTLDFPVNVNVPPNPDAGLDDTLCHDPVVGYTLNGSLENMDSDFNWAMTEFTGTGVPLFIYTGGATILNPNAKGSLPGLYEHVLYASDPLGICPDESDTVLILYSAESHTTTFTDPLCFGSADGTITVTSTGTIGANQYSVDGGVTFQASNVFTGLLAGSYSVVSMDPSGCTFTSTVVLTDPAEVVVSVSPDTTVCINGTATVSASAIGGTTYLFHWDMTASTAPSQTVSPTVGPTMVSVYAENEFGCLSTPKTITINLYDPITLTSTPNDTVCPGFLSGAEVYAVGGFMGYTYSWTANGVALPDVASAISSNPTSETIYCVTVADGCETTPETICTRTAMREVPMPIFTADTTQGCNPTEINFTNLTPSHLLGDVVWTINGVELSGTSTLNYTFDIVGTYDIGLEVTSPYGCYGSFMASDYITIHGNPQAIFYALPNPTTIFDTEVTMSNLTDGGDLNSYAWEFPGASPANSTESEPTILYPEGVAGIYPVTLSVVDENNCVDSVTSFVTVMSDVIVYAPNVFTPDGDALNQTWRVYIDGIDFYDFHLTLFNRWGEIVWESYNAIGEWDGSYGSTPAKDGTYIWVVNAKDANSDKLYEFRGHVTVLK